MIERTRVLHATHSSTLLARVALRSARLSVRRHRSRSRWWSVDIVGPDDLRLVPATASAARSWQHLVAGCGARPPAIGVSASPLGGAALDAVDWARRCLDLRAAARRGEAYCYLVHHRGVLVGEALGFVDAATSAIEIVVWLAPDAATPWRTAECIDLLATHALAARAGDDSPRRAACTVRGEDSAVLDSLLELGFVPEGELSDPPHAHRTVVVTGLRSESV